MLLISSANGDNNQNASKNGENNSRQNQINLNFFKPFIVNQFTRNKKDYDVTKNQNNFHYS